MLVTRKIVEVYHGENSLQTYTTFCIKLMKSEIAGKQSVIITAGQ
jgi:hypothetical protein